MEAPVMEPGLAAQFPDIKTYAGIGLDDPTATLRCDLTPRGFHAQVLSRQPGGTFYLDPVDAAAPASGLVSYWRQDLRPRASSQLPCLVQSGTRGSAAVQSAAQARAAAASYRVQTSLGTTLRTYRLALAATGEYTAFTGGTTASALAAMTTSVNRVTGVYEKELGVRLVLVANTNLLIFTNAATDPYSNTDGEAMLTQNQTRIDAVIGNANYDIGHVFSTGGGGVAVAGVCTAGDKALGVTGQSSPVGDPFDIDYVCHEMGHQFGGNHPFNGSVGSCAGVNREATMAYEPGSGSTIMAYAGICDGSGTGGTGTSQDLQPHSDAYFHGANISEITTFILSTTCATSASSGNTPPTVTTPANKSIPANTPFRLTGAATDADGDALTYNWEEMDLGAQGAPVKPSTVQTTGSTVPLFRSWTATTSPVRYFPRLNELRSGTVAYGEAIPTVARTLKFRCTVRDQHFSTALGRIVGGVNQSNTVTLTTVASTGFAVTAPNTAVSLTGGAATTVSWSVAGTTAAPISCALVDVLLSTDGGLTFPTTLAAGVANSGSASVTVPNTATTQGRIMVAAADNYFFDISNVNFTITAAAGPTISSFTPASGCPGATVTITGTGFTGATAVTFNNVAAASFSVGSATSITAVTPAGVTTGTVKVTAPGGTATSAGSFTPTAAPTITSFTPTSGAVGTSVTLTGTNFTGATSVKFNNTSATFTVVSATSITATLPAGATTGTLSVTGVCGTVVPSAGSFTVTAAAPTISSFTPTSGCGGATVTITGTGFTGATAVTFNNVAAASFTVGSATSITAVTPAGVTAGTVKVTTPGGTATSASAFTPTAAPTITSFTPTSGAVGTSVTITGTGFTGATAVKFNGTAATTFSVGSATSITATVPTGATTGLLSVTGACGAVVPSTGSFTVTTAVGPPTITSFTPLVGAPGTVVTITGTNLSGATLVKFNGKPIVPSASSATTITVAVPPLATTGKLSVTAPGGTVLSTASFTVAPIITSFTPGAGSVGSVVILTGLNFTSTTSVKVNGVAATTTFGSATQLTAVVPATATTGPLSATNTAGTGTSATSFTITAGAAPTISSFTPTNAAAGVSVTITGTGFTGATAIRFNATTTPATVLSATQVRANVPAGATTGLLYVVTPTGMARSATAFTVNPAPTLTSFAPASGSPGAVVVLTGTNFIGVTSVAFNGVAVTPATLVVSSATAITVKIPAGASTGRITVATPAGTCLSATDFVVTADPAPTITSFSPATGPVGTVVTITGTNLLGTSAVKFNATAATSFAAGSTTSVTATVPAGTTTGTLFVTAEGGMAQSSTSFTVILPPTITSFTPTSGPGGTLVTINGTNLTGASAVRFGGVNASAYTVVSSIKITATVPTGAVTGAVTVTTVAGTATKSTFTYTGARSGPLAVTAEESVVPIEVYPNPAHELVRVSGQPGSTVTLRDGVGRVFCRAPLTEGTTTLDVRGLPAGLYTVTVGTTTRRLVVE